ncbi:MAG: recombinase family protein [Planctomycetales bacterium]|nr:recombinase family protein [Planctomycetales bacterium]
MIKSDFDPRRRYVYVCYGRMSDPGQNPRSPDQQFDTIEETRKRCAYPWRHLKSYRDDGISGRYLQKRKGFQEMLTDIRTGMCKPDIILIDTPMRLGRCEEMEAIQRELLNKHGVLVLSADTNFADPSSEAGRAMRFAQNFQATAESRTRAHNVLRGKRDAARLGRWPGGPAPLGKRLKSVMKQGAVPAEVDYRVLEHDPETAGFVVEMYRHKHELGWGSSRSAKHFNNDPEFFRKVGHIDASTVGRILDNEIYKGTLVFGRISTDVVDDRRVMRKNPEDEIIRVENFCEPLITPEIWDEVYRLRREAGRKNSEARRRKRVSNGKLLQPTAPGYVLRYPLTGLVRCASCGASMRPNSCGAVSKCGRRYVYYICPGHPSGCCKNAIRVPEDWLRNVVISSIRKRLLPAPSDGSDATSIPDWFSEVFDEVQAAWNESRRAQIDPSPLLEAEYGDLQKQIDGWIQSLSRTDLNPDVRRLIESQVADATARQAEIKHELDQLDTSDQNLADTIKPECVQDALHRLTEVLAGANPNAMNAELALHIDRILVHPDRRVVMHTCRLGAFDGLVEILIGNDVSASADESAPNATTTNNGHRIRPRRRARLRLDSEFGGNGHVYRKSQDVHDPDRFAGLSTNWFWRDEFEIPWKRCWSKTRADEVARVRSDENLSLAKLAERFNKSIPTIRKALKNAADSNGH